MAAKEHWLTVQEVARLYRVHPQTVRRWGKSGLIEVVKFTGKTQRVLMVTDTGEVDDGLRQGQEGSGREEVGGPK